MPALFRTGRSLAAALLFGITVAGWCGAWHWCLDLTSHFRAYWLVASFVGLVLCLHAPRSFAFACCALALAGNAAAVLPFWLPTRTAAAPGANTRPLSLVSVNLLRRNADTSRAVDYLRERKPDVAVLVEIDAEWLESLASLAELYPFRVVEPREDNFGIAVLSRWPLADGRVFECGGTPYPNIMATVRFHDREVRLFATHPHPPFDAALTDALTGQLRTLADEAAAARGPRIVAGDFNATPWSLPYRVFTARSGLRDTALGHGAQPTWNARHPAPRIPIDQVFASTDLVVQSRAVGPDIGSDHLPVEVTFLLPTGD